MTPLMSEPNAVECLSAAPAAVVSTPGLSETGWRYTPHLIVFCSASCIMVVELVAGRLIARHLGSSLYTWTSIIGVVLTGMSIGNVIGGKLADRYKPEAILGWLFLGSAAACLLALGINHVFAETRPLKGLGWPVQIFFSVLIIFTLPALALGTISPTAAKMALARSNRIGATIGSFWACAVVGSILGTFLTGFWLIAALGSRGVMLATTAGLAALGLACRPWRAFGEPQPAARDAGPVARASLPVALADAAPPVSTEAVPALADDAARGGMDLAEEFPAESAEVGAFNEALSAWRYTPHVIVFFASACMMVVEMLASRMIARQVGSSLYTWTSVIGVILAGLSIGSFIGGRLADRFRPERFLGWLFMASSASCVVALCLNYYFWVDQPLKGLTWPALVFLTVLSVFILPSLLLGLFSPVAAKMALLQSTRVGFTIGTVSAWSTVGSILGTLGAGFWLVSALGTKGLLLFVGLSLAAAGLVFGPWRVAHGVWIFLLMLAFILARGGFGQNQIFKYQSVFLESRSDLFAADSQYQYIRVYETKSKAVGETDRTLNVLALDFLIHGYVDVKDPSHLEYDYEHVYCQVARRYAGDKGTVAALFLGGGSYTFPRWTLNEWPDAKIVVAEIDPLVVEANYRALGLPRDTPIRSIAMDARNAVDDLPEGELFDFAFGDAYNDLSTPFHLTTLEFNVKVKKHLKPDGAYLVNCIDSFDTETGLLVGSLTSTLSQAFKHVYVFCTEKEGVKKSRDTFVIAASDVELDTTGWEAKHTTDFHGSLLTPENMAELARKCGNRVLTDDDAPVENLIAPVLSKRKQN